MVKNIKVKVVGQVVGHVEEPIINTMIQIIEPIQIRIDYSQWLELKRGLRTLLLLSGKEKTGDILTNMPKVDAIDKLSNPKFLSLVLDDYIVTCKKLSKDIAKRIEEKETKKKVMNL